MPRSACKCADDCESCVVGTYSNRSGASSCTECSFPATTIGINATECDACLTNSEHGYYYDDVTDEGSKEKCHKCPDGAACDDAGARYTLETIPVKEKWYRFTPSAKEIYLCKGVKGSSGSNCKGSSTSSDGGGYATGQASCAENSIGPLCSLCIDDHFLNSKGACEECSPGAVTKSIAWIIALAVFGLALLVLWNFGEDLNIPWLQHVRKMTEDWILERKARFDWAAVSLRTIFYNIQILVKYTELQDVDWPFPFNGCVLYTSCVC